MSNETRDCAHCSGTGKCDCFSCVSSARGREHALYRQDYLTKTRAYKEVNVQEHPFLALLGHLGTPVAASLAKEVYRCTVCGGQGFFTIHPNKIF